MSDDDKLIHFDTYLDPYQAEMVRGVLETNDIQVHVEHSHVHSTMPHLQHALGGTRVMILLSDIERAKELLSTHTMTERVEGQPILPQTTGGKFRALLSFIATLIMMVPLPFKRRK